MEVLPLFSTGTPMDMGFLGGSAMGQSMDIRRMEVSNFWLLGIIFRMSPKETE